MWEAQKKIMVLRWLLSKLKIIAISDSSFNSVEYILKYNIYRGDRATSAHRSHKPKGVSG